MLSQKERKGSQKRFRNQQMSIERIDRLMEFLKANPNDTFVLFALALEYINQGNDEMGLRFFMDILKKDPEYTGVYYHLGKLYERLDQKKQAKETYEEGLRRTTGKEERSYRELQEALNQLTEPEDD